MDEATDPGGQHPGRAGHHPRTDRVHHPGDLHRVRLAVSIQALVVEGGRGTEASGNDRDPAVRRARRRAALPGSAHPQGTTRPGHPQGRSAELLGSLTAAGSCLADGGW